MLVTEQKAALQEWGCLPSLGGFHGGFDLSSPRLFVYALTKWCHWRRRLEVQSYSSSEGQGLSDRTRSQGKKRDAFQAEVGNMFVQFLLHVLFRGCFHISVCVLILTAFWLCASVFSYLLVIYLFCCVWVWVPSVCKCVWGWGGLGGLVEARWAMNHREPSTAREVTHKATVQRV